MGATSSPITPVAALRPGQAFVLLPIQPGETPLRQALIDDNTGHVNLLVCEADYKALKRGIEHLPPVSSSVKHPMSGRFVPLLANSPYVCRRTANAGTFSSTSIVLIGNSWGR